MRSVHALVLFLIAISAQVGHINHMEKKSHTMSLLEWMMLVALAIVWAGTFFFAEIAVAEIPPITIAFLRV